jgi:hypothetical protein
MGLERASIKIEIAKRIGYLDATDPGRAIGG